MAVLTEELGDTGFLSSLLSDDVFIPSEPRNMSETGINSVLIESLILKFLLQVGSASGRKIGRELCLPHNVIEEVLDSLRSRQVVVHSGQAQLNDYYYALTDVGNKHAQAAMNASGYVGAVPVPLEEYVLSVDAQTIRAEAPTREQLERAFRDISITPGLLDQLGPAINSGAGLFLYGDPGNGKTTIARRITKCFGQTIWIPRTLLCDGQYIKLFDEAYHRPVRREEGLADSDRFDRRWVKIERPTVTVGGELTMDGLELRHDVHTNVCEASLQLKSNCGVFLIDDFGRQRIAPAELLNRWIVPLENGHDFLTLPTGKKILVPFEQLIIFSTNLDPAELGDEAFLRRIPYKIEIGDPSEEEFHDLFKMFCRKHGCPYREDVVTWLIREHYEKQGRNLRRCQPRDLLLLIRNLCVYKRAPLDLRQEHFSEVVKTYFTVVHKSRDARAKGNEVESP